MNKQLENRSFGYRTYVRQISENLIIYSDTSDIVAAPRTVGVDDHKFHLM
jgi:hypothetical protein